MRKLAIVDVDDTLWDFDEPLLKILHERHGLPVELHRKWDWYLDYGITERQFRRAIEYAHDAMALYPAYDGAKTLFAWLNKSGYEVIVASHKPEQLGQGLARWLERRELLPYSGLYTGSDKLFLIQPGALVIDDKPSTIDYAADLGATAVTLAFPWNEGTKAAYRAKNMRLLVKWLRVNI